MDSEESYSACSSATRTPTHLARYLSNVVDLIAHFCEHCDTQFSASSVLDSSDIPLTNMLFKIADMLAELDSTELFLKYTRTMTRFLSNFITVNPRRLNQQDARLAQAVAQVLLTYSEQLEFVERVGMTKEMKRKILECGQVSVDKKALSHLKRAGRNFLRIH